MKLQSIPAITLSLAVLSLSACDQLTEKFSDGSSDSHLEAHEVANHMEGSHGEAEHDASQHAGDQREGDQQHSEEHSAGENGEHHVEHKIVVTSPVSKDIVNTQQYVCQIHSSRHIEVKALEGGYLEEITVKEGQFVKKGDVIFKILPTLYQARLEAEIAEAELAVIELQNTERLFQQNIVAQPKVALAKAKLAKIRAQVKLTQAELDFAQIKAPFDGIVDKQHEQQGSLIEEGAVLTTLSDNSVMWAYFNVPEARYLAYQANPDKDNLTVELVLADGNKFPYVGTIGAVEADFNNETGNIAFRGDFPNPDYLLRHGQTGTILLSRVVPGALVIPQRATFEILAKKYAYVVGEDNVVHQREIVIQHEQDDIYIISKGLDVRDKIILEGIRQVRDGEKVDYEFQAPEDVLNRLKFHAE